MRSHQLRHLMRIKVKIRYFGVKYLSNAIWKKTSEIELDQNLDSKEIIITGLYDPEDYDLDIYMWTNSDGDQLKDLFGRISNLDLSEDAID